MVIKRSSVGVAQACDSIADLANIGAVPEVEKQHSEATRRHKQARQHKGSTCNCKSESEGWGKQTHCGRETSAVSIVAFVLATIWANLGFL